MAPTKEALKILNALHVVWEGDSSVDCTLVVFRRVSLLKEEDQMTINDVAEFFITLPKYRERLDELDTCMSNQSKLSQGQQLPIPSPITYGQLKGMRRDRGF